MIARENRRCPGGGGALERPNAEFPSRLTTSKG